MVYARRVDDQGYTFGVSGKLARNALVMYDHQTDSLWSQITGEAIVGPLSGTRLKELLSDQLNWATWKSRHPGGSVLSKTRYPHRTVEADPYAESYVWPSAGLFGPASIDPRLEARQYVLGLALHGKARAYPYWLLQRQPVLNDIVGGTPVLIVFSSVSGSALAYERYTATSIELAFELAPESSPGEPLLKDTTSGSRWNGLSGEAVSGPWKGWAINRLPVTSGFWLAWREYYPHTDVYGWR